MKKEYQIYKLNFQTALHLSKGKLNTYESSNTTLHSDTIKAALFVCIQQLYGLMEAEAFMDHITVSSAFPFDENGYYFPKPVSLKLGETVENRKQIKNIKYLNVSQLEQAMKGNIPTGLLNNDGLVMQPKIWQADTNQRVKVNYDIDNEPYYWEKLYPLHSDKRGLFFVVTGDYDRVKLENSLKLLGDNGIGSRKTLGNGQFTVSKDTLSVDLADNAISWMNISLYYPVDKNEIAANLDRCRYSVIKRGGWIVSPMNDSHTSLRKKSIMMFTEGSVFYFNESTSLEVKGRKVNIQPDIMVDHPVWRDGKAIFLPVFDLYAY